MGNNDFESNSEIEQYNYNYIAHISDDGREQTVKEHLQNVAKLAGEFASVFGAEKSAYAAGLLHDLGKYSSEFQKRIRGDPHRVNHSDYGAQLLWRNKRQPEAICVAGHHSGLPDWGSKYTASPDGPTMLDRMSRQNLPDASAFAREIAVPELPPIPSLDFYSMQMYIRMLYSCLVDADFLDTEEFVKNKERDKDFDGICTLNEKLDEYIDKKGFLSPQNDMNRKRAEILRSCIEAAKLPSGLFSLTVPTGGGKTVASLSFAIKHAVANGKRRVIYVIPYCSIIDQNAKIFREILGDKNVLEYHSGAVYADENDERHPMALAAENWDKPVVVTTAVQFFESLYAACSSKCRKLHNIADSVVIFDEAQMIPNAYIDPCVGAIANLVEKFGVTAVLCTATQPAFEGVLKRFAPNLKTTEICPNTADLYEALKRVTIRIDEAKHTDSEIAKMLMRSDQVLCIANRRASAYQICRHLSGEGNYHLSTLMYPAERERVLNEIRERLENGLACRVVSTSLIEAGVDVDFPTVYRERNGLDSILQAAGRCNREGKRSRENSIVTVFSLELKDHPQISKNIGAFTYAVHKHSDPTSPEAIHTYFSELMAFINLDEKNIMPSFREPETYGKFPFRTVADKFNLIESNTKTVYVPLGNGKKLLDELMAGGHSRNLFRQLGRYGVTVYDEQFQNLVDFGHVKMCEQLGSEAGILVNTNLYHRDTGLEFPEKYGMGIMA